MRITHFAGHDDLAVVYLGETRAGKWVEFVESVQPPLPRVKKWVLIVSTLYGCPIGCAICDAGGQYHGRLTKDEILEQIDFLVRRRFPDGQVPVEKFKVQFARVGEPALNLSVLEALEALSTRYDAPGLIPCVSTVAPAGTGEFFARLRGIKKRLYQGRFQLQFSIHSTDQQVRRQMICRNIWDFEDIAEYGSSFYEKGDRKITLNFALAEGAPLESQALKSYFDPDTYLVKITPVNPTYSALRSKVSSQVDVDRPEKHADLVSELNAAGYKVIISVGELEENEIGSNCGQYLKRHLETQDRSTGSYASELRRYGPGALAQPAIDVE